MITNPYIKTLRAPFADEIKDPVTAHLVVGMMVTEDDRNPLPVLESLFNRTCYVRSHGLKKSLVAMITGGFYGPYNRHKYPSALATVASSPVLRARLNDAIDQALAGSNMINGYTDQGLPTDPNGGRQPRIYAVKYAAQWRNLQRLGRRTWRS